MLVKASTLQDIAEQLNFGPKAVNVQSIGGA